MKKKLEVQLKKTYFKQTKVKDTFKSIHLPNCKLNTNIT